jgi:murein endopeptidase
MRLLTLVVIALAAVASAKAFPIALSAGDADSESRVARPTARQARSTQRPPALPASRRPAIRWRRSVAVGLPTAGRLVRGVQLPARGPAFATWDANLRRSPNRGWRRWGTNRLVRLLLAVAREYRGAHPSARPLLIGDLSRPHGGDFGRRFGYVWHASHQNGLDVDVYYPRRDRARRAPRTAADLDRRLSQELVNRFVRAGATDVFVGPGTGLTGAPDLVQVIPDHDDHMHVRIGP